MCNSLPRGILDVKTIFMGKLLEGGMHVYYIHLSVCNYYYKLAYELRCEDQRKSIGFYLKIKIIF